MPGGGASPAGEDRSAADNTMAVCQVSHQVAVQVVPFTSLPLFFRVMQEIAEIIAFQSQNSEIKIRNVDADICSVQSSLADNVFRFCEEQNLVNRCLRFQPRLKPMNLQREPIVHGSH